MIHLLRFAPLPVVLVAIAAGCSDAPFDYVEASGKVTYDDGTPIPGSKVKVVFVSQTPPLDPKTHPRPGIAFPGPDGAFDLVTSHKYGDGICVGKHKVTIHSLNGVDRPTGAVPEEYTRPDTTPIEVDATETPFTLTIKKP